MKELFGIQMSSIAAVLFVLLLICLVTLLYIFLRKPIVFKMGMRNIPRRPAQTILIIIGLMLSTLIVAAALGVGDTLDTSVRKWSYDQLGEIDHLIVASQKPDADSATGSYFPESKYDEAEALLAQVPEVESSLPYLTSDVAVLNETSQLANPAAVVAGIDTGRIGAFDTIEDRDGQPIDVTTLGPGQAIITEDLANDIDADVGSTLTVFVNQEPTTLTVTAVASNSALLGFGENPDGTINYQGIGVSLPFAQELLGRPGQINSILVSQVGGANQTVDDLDRVADEIEVLLQGTGLGIFSGKASLLEAGEGISAGFTGIFMVLGLFSIGAGILLIVLIFTMLAAERRPEMGMARAVGQRRLQLIQQYISEGSGYALVAGFVGLLLGIGATILMAAVLDSLLGGVFPIKASITSTSMIAAYSLGVFITFLTVVASSWKVSRLNIVGAIRDIPDVSVSRRRWRTLVWAGLLILLGGLFTMIGASGPAFFFYAGISILPFGIAMVLTFFGVPGRLAYSLVGIYLLVVWLLPEKQFEQVFGEHDGDIELFFLSGIFLVAGSTLLIVQNTNTLLWLVTQIGSLFKSKLAAVKLAVAYPGASRGRTGMAIAMFSLIIFSLVMMATITRNIAAAFLNDDALAGWDITAQTNPGQPVDDFPGLIASSDINPADITSIGRLRMPDGNVIDIIQPDGELGSYDVLAMDEGFLDTTEWQFMYRATGYETDADVIEAIRNDPSLVLVDSTVFVSDPFSGPLTLDLTGTEFVDGTMQPTPLTLIAADGTEVQVKIIGVIDDNISTLFGIFGSEDGLAPVVGDSPTERYYIQSPPSVDSEELARQIEALTLRSGVQVVSIQAQLEEAQRLTNGFLYLIQGFMGLGLIVGIAAVGVISFRSVVERRQQIGMLRAIGLRKEMVSLAFLIETAYVVILGVIAGTVLGILLAKNLLDADSENIQASFTVPYGLIALILIGTVIVALLTAWVPSRQASNIAPADALRYE